MNNFTKRRIAFAVAAIGYVSAMVPAYAADDAVTAAPATSTDASKLERVEIVGSNIKRSNVSAQSTQIETYRTEDFAKKGATSAQDIVNSLASSQASIVGASSVGSDTAGASYANLRNIGAQYTLVLIDGRRVANQPGGTGGYAVDLNGIPVEAIERVEVLKDGASAIYGTDAIGGVINFITKKNYQGANASVSYSKPTSSGGGMEKSVSIGGGIGDLNNDGWNLQGTFGISKTDSLMASGRDSIVSRQPQWSSNTSPANYVSNNAPDYNLVNPAYPSCRGGDGGANTDGTGYCLENTSKFLSLSPEVSRWSATAKATKRVFDDAEFSLQYLHNETKTVATMAPTPMAGDVTLPSTSPYYPAGESGDLALYGRTIDAGSRVQGYKTTMDRLQSNLEGSLAGWDYKAGIGYSEAMGESTLKSGWINKSLLQTELNNGTFNPFGSNSASTWDSLSLTGLLNKSTMKMYTADYKMSRDVLPMAGGNMAVAFGTEIRREDLDSRINTALAQNAMSTGEEDSQSTGGGRTVYAFYGETLLPVMKGLEFNPAVRFDHYSDFGDTVNPKISFKATPIQQVMFRGSASTGFRAPTLYDMYSPAYTTYTGSSYVDPVGCPTGSGGAACVKQQQHMQYSGSTNLKAEKTYSTSIGMVVTPVKSFMASADLWTTVIKDMIGTIPENAIFSDPAKYANLLVADSSGNLAYAKNPTTNLGEMRTSGVDLAASWRLPSSALGNFVLSVNSTYTRFYQYQLEKGGAWINNLGAYSGDSVVFRWKTNTTLDWNRGDWSATLGANYLSGYTDEYTNDDGSRHVVPSLLLWNGSVSYNWNKQATFTLGARNLFDKQPPYSNQDYTFQTGYDPRYSDIYGRTIFMTMSYKM